MRKQMGLSDKEAVEATNSTIVQGYRTMFRKLPIDGNAVKHMFGISKGILVGDILTAEKEFLLDNPHATIIEIEAFVILWTKKNKSILVKKR
jgi:hypothetical protein